MKIVGKNIVIPMAGKGERFQIEGYKLSKPLIKVFGKTLIEWAMMSLNYTESTLIFLVLQEHIKKDRIDIYLRKKYKNAIIIPVKDVTEGQACTVLLSRKYIDNKDDLIIFNCDTYCKCNIKSEVEKFPNADCFIPIFKDNKKRWSYVKTDFYGKAIKVAEKNPISNNASTGLYYFKHGCDFIWAVNEIIKKNIRINGEFYIMPAINELIKIGKEVRIIKTDFSWVLGSPKDLDYFTNHYERKRKKE